MTHPGSVLVTTHTHIFKHANACKPIKILFFVHEIVAHSHNHIPKIILIFPFSHGNFFSKIACNFYRDGFSNRYLNRLKMFFRHNLTFNNSVEFISGFSEEIKLKWGNQWAIHVKTRSTVSHFFVRKSFFPQIVLIGTPAVGWIVEIRG